jgi:hypothetical protein
VDFRPRLGVVNTAAPRVRGGGEKNPADLVRSGAASPAQSNAGKALKASGLRPVADPTGRISAPTPSADHEADDFGDGLVKLARDRLPECELGERLGHALLRSIGTSAAWA